MQKAAEVQGLEKATNARYGKTIAQVEEWNGQDSQDSRRAIGKWDNSSRVDVCIENKSFKTKHEDRIINNIRSQSLYALGFERDELSGLVGQGRQI